MRSSSRSTFHSAVALAAVAVVASSSMSYAAAKRKPAPKPKPVCNLLQYKSTTATDPSLDVRSADVATNATTLTFAVRVATLTADPDTKSPTGRQWSMQFNAGTSPFGATIYTGPFGTTSNPTADKVTLDTAKNEIRYTISLAHLKQVYQQVDVKQGKTIISGIHVTAATQTQSPAGSTTGINSLAVGNTFSDAKSTAKYLAGTPSCLTVGS